MNGLMVPYFRTATDSVNRLFLGDMVDFKPPLHLIWGKFRFELRFSSILTIEMYISFFLGGIFAAMSSSFHLHSDSVVEKGEKLSF